MKQYIDKSAVVAEIEKRIADNKKEIERASHKNLEDYFEGYEDALVLFKVQFLIPLEVKEVNLEKALDNFYKQEDWSPTDAIEYDTHKDIARHFFVLGLNAQKEYNYESQ